ncbi:hypothetical protein [Rhizobacter sp. Root404]|uniref:hypothetical protein n=1 Tax=Rhizobacter sp. Root404 TaxID=1736528 RepID=UPI0007148E3A|nr:hypothetical protein [Rhizobacter sp. Root404]KQW36733.1 hypothetical protein ASC76_19040 [Rhizobacter sp. Root404]
METTTLNQHQRKMAQRMQEALASPVYAAVWPLLNTEDFVALDFPAIARAAGVSLEECRTQVDYLARHKVILFVGGYKGLQKYARPPEISTLK